MNTLATYKLLHKLILILFLGAFTASCTSLQPGLPSEDASGVAARQLSAQGDHTAASRTYLDLAVSSAGEQRQRYLIFSASELYLANDLDGADRILAEAGETIAPANLELWAQVTAELNLALGNPEKALLALNQVTSSVSQVTASHILLLRSDALFKLKQPELAVGTLLQREAILSRSKDIQANNRHIWTGLQITGSSIPPNIGSREGNPVLNGWLELGYISYSNRTSLTALSTSLEQWRAANPEHPASNDLLEEVLDGLSTLSNYPNRVAVLLPLSGKQKSLGEAIRDGYMAAHFSLGGDSHRPDIRIYDTARNGVTTAYQQAILGGAEFIIGPLLKTEVAEIAALSDDIPILALNFGPEDTTYPDRFYQFALSPEDEARAVANKAASEGLFNAVALVPESAWGKRILTAFQDELEQQGGKLLATRSYPTDSADYADVIRNVLLLDESYARRDRLAANMGEELEFKPRRRQDVDLIFIAATVAKGKQIRPQLKFHYAAELPTYATSAIYKPGSTDNADINGVLFPDIPWLLKPTQMVTYDKHTLKELWGAGSTQLARFYAMGYDAYHLSAMLNSSRRTKSISLQGMTGDIYMTQGGQLHRHLSWAKIERGKPRTLPDTSRNITQDVEIIIR
ncbi:MAG: ABC transporter substrate-binding protein [Gammaproteobacteria bacterium]|nr:ABC transporter substrate-binding protein [Gammaproteobacteria bacterium]MCP4088594.1 ABC transporter substrate-binding protein [Gammaproteobacteria bacterium]MCP4276498.1 ABC transporter substrate-binding protein [Gammaproteobacteria bacterium]MCP4832375.1 ABC transporter substrate-binding protein [Gammaproteobacteria bacterium]MCP4929111.1 ABC transporter substrate-binding protein [Gammaproteobacteria bacterium]